MWSLGQPLSVLWLFGPVSHALQFERRPVPLPPHRIWHIRRGFLS